MTSGYVISFFQEAITQAAILSLPPLVLGLIVGLMISIFQAVTQINEQTLSLIPKIVAIMAALLVFGNWMLNRLAAYTVKIFEMLPGVAGS